MAGVSIWPFWRHYFGAYNRYRKDTGDLAHRTQLIEQEQNSRNKNNLSVQTVRKKCSWSYVLPVKLFHMLLFSGLVYFHGCKRLYSWFYED